MLTLLDPSVLHHFEALPVGVQPFRNLNTGKLFICIKASKEAILAAKLNGGFKFYVAPLPSPWGPMPVLMTAFFDDADEPLLITTPLFDDEMPVHLKELLAYEVLQVHFLDEHNREWAAYHARLAHGGMMIMSFITYNHCDAGSAAAGLDRAVAAHCGLTAQVVRMQSALKHQDLEKAVGARALAAPARRSRR